MNINEILLYLKDLPLLYILLAFLINIGIMSFYGLIFKKITNSMGEPLSLVKSINLYYLGQIANLIMPFKTGVLVGKPFLFKKINNTPIKKAVLIIFFENLFHIIWQLAFLFILLLVIGEKFLVRDFLTRAVMLSILFASIILMALNHKRIFLLANKLMAYLPGFLKSKISRLNKHFLELHENFFLLKKTLLNFKMLFQLIIMIIPIILISPLILKISANLFDTNIPFFSAIVAIHWISYIIGRASFLPSGVGVRDLTVVGLLVAYNVPFSLSIKIALISRVISLLPVLIISAILSIYYGKEILKSQSAKIL